MAPKGRVAALRPAELKNRQQVWVANDPDFVSMKPMDL
jgi:hypothetical protein